MLPLYCCGKWLFEVELNREDREGKDLNERELRFLIAQGDAGAERGFINTGRLVHFCPESGLISHSLSTAEVERKASSWRRLS